MSTLCGCLAVLVFICGLAYSIQRDNAEYFIEFVLGAMFVIAVWIAITL